MWMLTLVLAMASAQARGAAGDAAAIAAFDKAPGWSQFLADVKRQRERWTGNAERAIVPPALAARLERAAPGLRMLIVAQDWCVDSANTVPYVARLAASAQIPVRIVDRAAGAAVMNAFRSRDGRSVTPLVILLREDRVAGVWVERPATLQRDFESMAADPAARRRFEDRQAWYDADRGVTTMTEIVELAERRAGGRGRLLLPH